MPVINISVENKIAEADGTLYVCGNSDFVAKFAFDAEWEAYETKTARFGYNNSYVDVVFTGDKCPVPIISGTYFFNIGVYAGDLHTTTPARVPCKKSILCDTGFPADPPNDVYNQIMAKLNSLESADPDDIAKAVADYLAAHPIEETDPTVPEWAKADITGAAVGQIAKIAAVDASGVPTAWEPVDMPSGGGEGTWEKIAEVELAEEASLITISHDLAGRPFALKRVMIDCSINIDQDNAMTFVKTLINDLSVCGNIQKDFTGKAVGYYAFYAELIPGSGMLAWHYAGDFNYNWINQLQKMGYKYNGIWEASAITKITISPNDGRKNFGIAGTKINVMGVRA